MRELILTHLAGGATPEEVAERLRVPLESVDVAIVLDLRRREDRRTSALDVIVRDLTDRHAEDLRRLAK